MKVLLSAVLLLSLGDSASASDARPAATGLSHWWTRMQQEFDALAEQKRVVPPVARKVRWRPSRIWSGELPGELVAMVAGDLNGDGKSELYALTTEKLIVLSRMRGLFDVRDTQDLPQAPALIRSREPIGALSLGDLGTGPTLRVRTSEQEKAGLYQLSEGTLSLASEFSGYPLCTSSTIEAALGRNFFAGRKATWLGADASRFGELLLGSDLQSASCSRGLVDPMGHAMVVVSEVSLAGTLRLQCIGDQAFCQAEPRQYPGVGYAHLVVDIDNDGTPEVVSTEASLPNEADSVRVRSLPVDGADRLLFEKSFAGGVVAVAAGDFEGDASLGLVVAVRKDNKVSLWLLN